MGRNLEFDSRVLELNSRFLPKASLPLCLGYSLPKKEKKFSTTALPIVGAGMGHDFMNKVVARSQVQLSLTLVLRYIEMLPLPLQIGLS